MSERRPPEFMRFTNAKLCCFEHPDSGEKMLSMPDQRGPGRLVLDLKRTKAMRAHLDRVIEWMEWTAESPGCGKQLPGDASVMGVPLYCGDFSGTHLCSTCAPTEPPGCGQLFDWQIPGAKKDVFMLVSCSSATALCPACIPIDKDPES